MTARPDRSGLLTRLVRRASGPDTGGSPGRGQPRRDGDAGARAGDEIGAGSGAGIGAGIGAADGRSAPGPIAAVIGPDAVETFPRMLRVGHGWTATLVVTGYPAEVGLAWLDVILRGSIRLDAAVHIEPLPPSSAAAGLRRARARLEATRRLDADRGRLGDPLTDIAAEDAADLADRLARGRTRLFRVGVYLTVHAPTRPALVEAVAQVQAAAASVLVDTHPATWRHLQGWTSTLPLGHDALRQRRVFDTDALALSFPLAGPDLPGPLPGRPAGAGGVLLGVTADAHGAGFGSGHAVSTHLGAGRDPGAVPGTGPGAGTGAIAAGTGVVWWDRWSQHNHNTLVLARSGAGKSYLVKLEILRSLYDDVRVAVIDPDEEYTALADAVGGTAIALGRPGVRVNPLDIPPGDLRPDALTRRALFLHTLVTVLLGHPLPPAERAALDTAIIATYARAGITQHRSTWARPAPLLRDLVEVLRAAGRPPTRARAGDVPGGTSAGGTSTVGTSTGRGGPVAGAGTDAAAAGTLAARLMPWTHGSFKDLFDGPTTVTTGPGVAGPLTVWSTRHLPDELRAAGMLLALDAIWRDVDAPPPPGGPDPSPGRGAPGDPAGMVTGSAGPGRGGRQVQRQLVVVDEAVRHEAL